MKTSVTLIRLVKTGMEVGSDPIPANPLSLQEFKKMGV
jgi:hypothetical protein